MCVNVSVFGSNTVSPPVELSVLQSTKFEAVASLNKLDQVILRRSHPRNESVGSDAERFALLRQAHCRLQNVVRGPTGIRCGLAHAADVQGNVARACAA
jgi:hypothetical protein